MELTHSALTCGSSPKKAIKVVILIAGIRVIVIRYVQQHIIPFPPSTSLEGAI
jgi:hypothetical protein